MAELLGLSTATVSRALNDSYEISQKTKDKVNALAKELNYEPNPFASSLRQHKSKTIALIIPEISSIFFSQITKGVEAISNHKGYHVIICCSNESYDTEKNIVKHLISGRVDGILLSASANTFSSEHMDRFIERKIPVVLFDRILDRLNVASVTSNDYESSFSATLHLINKGCQKIAFLKLGSSLSNIEKRHKGYLDALNQHKLNSNKSLALELSNDKKENLELIKIFIKTHQPDAIFASVEHLAFSTYDACKELRLRIPTDIKVLAYSNLEIARHLSPPLTTIVQPAYEMGKNAAIILLNQINKKSTDNGNIVISSELVLRESTDF